MEKRNGEREGGTTLHSALHSQALRENVSQKRCQHSTVSCLLGKSVIQGRLTKIFHISPKVAKGPKVPSLSSNAARLQEQAETSPFRKNGEWQVKGQEEASPRFWCCCVLASMLRGCTDSLSSLPGSCPPPGVPSFAFTCQPDSQFSSSWESPHGPLRVKPCWAGAGMQRWGQPPGEN